MKMIFPRSRRRLTQPMSTAFFPASEGLNVPHMSVRRKSPKKSSKVCPYSENDDDDLNQGL